MTRLAERRQHALAIYRAALEGADPRPPLLAALGALPASSAPLYVLGIGKASGLMAEAALAAARTSGRPVVEGLLIAPQPAALPGLRGLSAEHPVPGPGSKGAAAALAALTERVPAGAEVWVLLSGGTSSLLAAPVEGIPAEAFGAAWRELYGAGLPIGELNLVRKRLARWGAGRLAVALARATVRTFALSDVPGDEPAAIGSGPCDPDSSTAEEVRRLLDTRSLAGRLDPSILEYLGAVERGERPETAKPGSPAFRTSAARVIAGNDRALAAASAEAVRLGYAVEPGPPLDGEAAECGVALGRLLLESRSAPAPVCRLQGGEPVVTMPRGHRGGTGGRAQELALAAAGVLESAAPADATVLLAGSTDGRDGPTDAAGALVDRGTWRRCRDAGTNPADALTRHDSYAALAASGDLIRTGPTGTNVMDVVLGLTG